MRRGREARYGYSPEARALAVGHGRRDAPSESIFRFVLGASRWWSLGSLSHNIRTPPDRLQEPLRSAALGGISDGLTPIEVKP